MLYNHVLERVIAATFLLCVQIQYCRYGACLAHKTFKKRISITIKNNLLWRMLVSPHKTALTTSNTPVNKNKMTLLGVGMYLLLLGYIIGCCTVIENISHAIEVGFYCTSTQIIIAMADFILGEKAYKRRAHTKGLLPRWIRIDADDVITHARARGIFLPPEEEIEIIRNIFYNSERILLQNDQQFVHYLGNAEYYDTSGNKEKENLMRSLVTVDKQGNFKDFTVINETKYDQMLNDCQLLYR